MGAACSLDASYEDEENHLHEHPHHSSVPDSDAAPEKSRRAAAVHVLSPQQRAGGAGAAVKSYKADASLPRDVQLHRMWTSVVVGELVKNHQVSAYDETHTVLQVVQGMIRSGANYAIIRKIRQPDTQAAPASAPTPAAGSASAPTAGTPASSTSAAARSFRLTRRSKAEAETYVGLFDWRDLNSLLVSVCKSNRLHNTTSGSNAAAAAQRVSAAPAADKRPTEDEDTEDLEPESAAVSPAPAQRSLEVAPLTPSASSANLLQARVATANSPAGGSKRAIQLVVTSAPAAQPAASSSGSSIPASHQASSTPRVNDVNGAPPASDKSEAASGSLGLDGDGALAPQPSVGSPPTLASYLHFLDMKRAPIRLVSNLSGRNPMQVVNTACPLLGGAQLLVGLIGANHQHVAPPATSRRSKVGADSASAGGAGNGAVTRPELYRLTVTDKDGVCVGCMTQLALCSFVKDKLAAMGALADQSLLELGLGRNRRAMTVSWKSPVLTAMLLMHDRRLSALAIVNDSNGKLVGTISCSDVKYLFLAPELLLTLQRPVSVFIHMLRQSTSYWHVNLSSNPPPTAVSQSVTVTTKTSFRQTVDTLLSNKVRRAWIVNDQQQPIGMVSISDIVKFALPPQHAPAANAAQHH